MNKYFTTQNLLKYLTLILIVFFTKEALTQTSGNLTFNMTTNRTFQNYDPRNIMAVWITDDANNFVQTLKKRANNREQYLYQWIASTNRNTVNAITGSTLSSHQTHNLNWNCQDVSGSLVPDGWYKVRCEFTTRNGQGPWMPVDYIRFYKGNMPVDTTYNNFNYNGNLAFSNISLVYTPDVTAIDDSEMTPVVSDFYLYQNYPNPFNPTTTIEFDISEQSGISQKTKIVIFNSIGQSIRTLYDGNMKNGKYKITWAGKNNKLINQPSGVYYVQLISGSIKLSRKMLLLR